MIPRKRPLLALLFAQAFLLALFILSVPASAAHHAESKSHEKDIVDVAVASGDFDTLVAALQAADLVQRRGLVDHVAGHVDGAAQPALGGETPRAAVRTEAGREQVDLLLVTHAAVDHLGDAEAILRRFPDLPLICGADVRGYLMFGFRWDC